MYFVVPKGRSIIKNVFKADNCYNAQVQADRLHRKTGEHFEVIRMAVVHTTETMAERLEQDMAEKGVAA